LRPRSKIGEGRAIGGQSLMPMLKLRLVETGCLIDLDRIPALAAIR
jgi:CO/xanthine dehydrogenase FAD-binding subunit